jgi:intein-encoded DNA endonuclease-like protein
MKSAVIGNLKKASVKNWTLPYSKKEIFDMYSGGKSCSEIAQLCSCNPSNIFALMRRNNIPRRKISDINRKYKINESYFNEIDSEEKAYFLGFLFADGDNNTKKYVVRLRLKYTDEEILQKLNSLIENESPIRHEKARDNFKKGELISSSDTCGLYINSKKISERLNQLGFTPKKSFTVRFPEEIPCELYRHFIRGYFDGNGCLGYFTRGKRLYFDIDGSELILSKVQEILIENLKISKTKLSIRAENLDGRVVSMRYSGKNALLIIDWIYNGASIYLERKYKKLTQ